MKKESLKKFFANVESLSKNEKCALVRNHKSFQNTDFNTKMILIKCIPTEEEGNISDAEWQNLLFVASVRCELGYEKVSPQDAVTEVLTKTKSGRIHYSDLLKQDTASGRVYPLMRRYLSRFKKPVDVYSLFYDLQWWDVDDTESLPEWMNQPVKYKWVYAFASKSAKKK